MALAMALMEAIMAMEDTEAMDLLMEGMESTLVSNLHFLPNRLGYPARYGMPQLQGPGGQALITNGSSLMQNVEQGVHHFGRFSELLHMNLDVRLTLEGNVLSVLVTSYVFFFCSAASDECTYSTRRVWCLFG